MSLYASFVRRVLYTVVSIHMIITLHICNIGQGETIKSCDKPLPSFCSPLRARAIRLLLFLLIRSLRGPDTISQRTRIRYNIMILLCVSLWNISYFALWYTRTCMKSPKVYNKFAYIIMVTICDNIGLDFQLIL